MTSISRDGEYFEMALDAAALDTVAVRRSASAEADRLRPVRGLLWAICLAAALYAVVGMAVWLAF